MRVTIALRSSPLIGPKSTTACSPTKQAYTSTTIAPAVLRDRRHLAEDGMVMAIVTLSADDGSVAAPPEIITRGFIYVKESDELMDELRRVAEIVEKYDLCHVSPPFVSSFSIPVQLSLNVDAS